MVDSDPHAGQRRVARAARHRLRSDPTRLAIIDALAQAPREVSELARLVGVHPNTVRAHLRRLEDAGLVVAERAPTRRPGRPPMRYRLLPLAVEGEEYALLVRGLAAMVRRAHADAAPALATAEGERLGRAIGRGLGVSGPSAALLRLLEELSFAPTARRRRGRLHIELHHCPFAALIAEDGPIICAFHLGLLRGVAEATDGDPDSLELHPLVAPTVCRVEFTTTG